MSNLLTNADRLEKVMFQSGLFTVKSVTLLGSKGANSNRLNPIYERTFPSNKYNDRTQLTSTRFIQNEYIALAYNNFEEKINEEIFVSYPHFNSLLDFFTQCLELLNTPGVFTNNGVSVQYSDVAVESDVFASNKRMIAVPTVWDDKDNNMRKGILLFLNSEEIATQLEITGVTTLLYILETFNLGLSSDLLFLKGMVTELSAKVEQLMGMLSGGNKSYQGGSSNQGSSTTRTSTTGGTKRGLFGNNTRKANTGYNNYNKSSAPTNDSVEETVEEAPIQEQQKPAGRRLSMGAITQKASEIEIEDMDDVQI